MSSLSEKRLISRMEYRVSRMDLALYSTLPCDWSAIFDFWGHIRFCGTEKDKGKSHKIRGVCLLSNEGVSSNTIEKGSISKLSSFLRSHWNFPFEPTPDRYQSHPIPRNSSSSPQALSCSKIETEMSLFLGEA